MRAPFPEGEVSISFTGVAKSITSRRLFSSSGRVVFRKSTTILSPSCPRLTPTEGSESVTMTLPSPASPRRKSIFSIFAVEVPPETPAVLPIAAGAPCPLCARKALRREDVLPWEHRQESNAFDACRGANSNGPVLRTICHSV